MCQAHGTENTITECPACASPEWLAMAGRVVSSYEHGEKGRVDLPTEGQLPLLFIDLLKETVEQ